jgi:transcriptional regulator with XRE-family HTH domain
MPFGQRIKNRRLELGLKQEELAQRVGISNGFLSDIENGKRGISAETLLDIGRVLGLSLDFLMKGEPNEIAAVSSEVEIPRPLAEFAANASLSFRQTLVLLQMQRQLIANRSSSDKEQRPFDWAKFYESVKQFL